MRVLYLLGPGRTGTTALTGMLGDSPDIVAAGEVQNLWTFGGLDQVCSCRATAADCNFWAPVLDRWARGIGLGLGALIDQQAALQQMVRTRHIPKMIAVSGTAGPTRVNADHARYVRNYVALLHSIADHSARAVVLDSSKRTAEAFLLRQQVDLYPVLVMRHPLGVVSSYRQPKVAQVADRTEAIEPKSVIEASALWVVHGMASRKLFRSGPELLITTQEEFARSPEEVVGRVCRYVNSRQPGVEESAPPTRSHLIGGNPDRLGARVAARSKSASRLTATERRVTLLMTSTERRHYDYSRHTND